MNEINKQQAIDIYELVANDSYVCEISDVHSNDRERSTGNGSDMVTAIKEGHYSEFYLGDADKDEATETYNSVAELGKIHGKGFDEYEYHRLTIVGDNLMEVAYIPKGGW